MLRSTSEYSSWSAAIRSQPRHSASVCARARYQAGTSERPTWRTLPERTIASSVAMTSSSGVRPSQAWSQ
jgi:hypothetical protein